MPVCFIIYGPFNSVKANSVFAVMCCMVMLCVLYCSYGPGDYIVCIIL